MAVVSYKRVEAGNCASCTILKTIVVQWGMHTDLNCALFSIKLLLYIKGRHVP